MRPEDIFADECFDDDGDDLFVDDRHGESPPHRRRRHRPAGRRKRPRPEPPRRRSTVLAAGCLVWAVTCLILAIAAGLFTNGTPPPRSESLRPAQTVQSPAATPSDVTYTIISEDVVPGFKRGLDVRLSRRVTRTELTAIATELRDRDSRTYDRTLIGFYLPGMQIDAGYWATTQFNPELEIRVIGAETNTKPINRAFGSTTRSKNVGTTSQRPSPTVPTGATAIVRVQVWDDTEQNPMPRQAAFGLQGQLSWQFNHDQNGGPFGRDFGPQLVGERGLALLYPDGTGGQVVRIPYMMTAAMNPQGSARDSIIINIGDTEIEVVGLPIKAATGKASFTVPR